MINNIPDAYKDGIRLLMLTLRSKEGGKNNKPDRVAHKKLSNSIEEFNKIFNEFVEIAGKSTEPLRIYTSVNKRDINKGIRNFKKLQLEADYWDIESKNSFYLDIKNRWISCIMQPNTREETNFLIDIDGNIDEYMRTKLNLLQLGIDIIFEYPTKNGFHIITKPFNPSLLTTTDNEHIKKDGLILAYY
jgi:hypothetical protein